MTLRSTIRNIGILVGTFLVGAIAGILAWEQYQYEPTADRGQVVEDTSQLRWDDLASGLLPNQTRVYQPMPTWWECMPVPGEIVDSSKAKPDTVTEYRTLFTSVEGPTSPRVDWGDRSGLSRLAESRHPFLFLPLLSSGKPAIDHNGQRTIVSVYGQNGRPYEFRYEYQPRQWELFVEGYLDSAWWPPLSPTSIDGEMGVDVGLRRKTLRVQIGPQLRGRAHVPLDVDVRPAVHVRTVWRPWSTTDR